LEFYFGFHGGTSTAEATIEGIRFLTQDKPSLAITAPEPNAVDLHWLSAAAGWQLEHSDSLTAGSWTSAGLPYGAEVEDGVMTLRQPAGLWRRFYRLRRVE
jgi:hypothetical protein